MSAATQERDGRRDVHKQRRDWVGGLLFASERLFRVNACMQAAGANLATLLCWDVPLKSPEWTHWTASGGYMLGAAACSWIIADRVQAALGRHTAQVLA